MGFLNENMTWAFVYFLNCGFFKNFGIVIVCCCLFQQLKVDKACNTPIFFLVWDGLLLKGKVFFLTLFNTEDKHIKGDSQAIMFVVLSGIILKTCLSCHLYPKRRLNYPSRWFISLKSEDTKTLGLKLNIT